MAAVLSLSDAAVVAGDDNGGEVIGPCKGLKKPRAASGGGEGEADDDDNDEEDSADDADDDTTGDKDEKDDEAAEDEDDDDEVDDDHEEDVEDDDEREDEPTGTIDATMSGCSCIHPACCCTLVFMCCAFDGEHTVTISHSVGLCCFDDAFALAK